MNLTRYGNALKNWDNVEVDNDFINFTTATDGWTSLVVDVGSTATVGDAINGVLALGTDATANDEVDVRTTAELFRFGTNRGIYGRVKLQYSEANTDDAQVFIGFMSALAADSITDAGAIRASGSIAGIYKVLNGTVWRCHTANNGTVTDTISTKTAGGATAQTLEIELNDWDGVSMQATFKVDGEYLKDSNNLVIRHTVLIASST